MRREGRSRLWWIRRSPTLRWWRVGTSGVATVTVSGLTAGPHTISAIYGTSGGFTGSNSGTAQSFSISQDVTTTTWTPGGNKRAVQLANRHDGR